MADETKENTEPQENKESENSLENGEETIENLIEIGVSEDKMEALLCFTGQPEITADKIFEQLTICKIINGVDNHAIDYIVSSFNSDDPPVNNSVIARGTPVKKGRDGEITYCFNTNTDAPSYDENKDGSIDIRETNVVQSVEEGAEIAFIVPHIDSTGGKDVYGKIVPPAKVKKVTLRTGKNVRVSEDGLHFFSETGGRPILEGDKITVSEVFTVSGDLDLSIGNIDFDGVVEINGDVENGFKVKASKSIIIQGLVGDCEIEAGLNIEICGGCNSARFVCGQDFETKYMNDSYINARGNITIKNAAVNSTLTALGSVNVRSGLILGGEITAKKGILSKDIGSDAGLKTVLAPGRDLELEEKCAEIDGQIIDKNKEMSKIEARVAPLLKNKELLEKFSSEQREKLKETLNYVQQLLKEKDTLNSNKNDLIAETMKDAVPEVIVFHNIYQGVILKIGESRREISSKLEGPLRLYEEDEKVTVEPYSEAEQKEKK